MTLYKIEEQEKLRREKTREAIALATESRWEEAAAVNRQLVNLFPDDVEAYNRLGKACFELGQVSEARQAFQKALEMAPTNVIARKNLARLAHLKESSLQQPKKAPKVTPQLFIEESGKTTLTGLTSMASGDVLAGLSAGDPVTLRVQGIKVVAEDSRGLYLGSVESHLALRLIRLIGGGNRYEAAITRLTEQKVVLLIREVYRHPALRGVVSFPTKQVAHVPVQEDVAALEGAEEELASVPVDTPDDEDPTADTVDGPSAKMGGDDAEADEEENQA